VTGHARKLPPVPRIGLDCDPVGSCASCLTCPSRG
jgi:hypothetical protein